jgi:predicted NAD-dependent protein-ADP-ribosyltransferase YbiA (DUF1768 family)
MTKVEDSICFYEVKKPFYEFSNFYVAPFHLDGKTWNTVEHYFQASKFTETQTNMEYSDIIRSCNTPGKCFILARQKKKGGYAGKWTVNPKNTSDTRTLNDIIDQYASTATLRHDWDDVKIDIMRKALVAKFTQHPQLKNLLLSTSDRPIVEDSPRDDFWGRGKNYNGQNWLGRLLMEVREECRVLTPSKGV